MHKVYTENIFSHKSFIAGVFCLYIVSFLFITITIGYLLGISVSSLNLPLAVILSSVLIIKQSGLNIRNTCLVILESIAGITIIGFIMAFLPDFSSDGNYYHQESVILQVNGWNPVYSPTELDISIWIKHYAKALEVTSAGILALTHNLESSKVINWILYIASVLIPYNAIRNLGWSRRKSISVTILLSCNPVVIGQLFTFFNDFAIYCELVILVSVFALIVPSADKKNSLYLWGIAVAITILAINTKFTHFMFIGIAWIIFGIYLIITRYYDLLKPYLAFGVISVLLGAAVTGFHPYVTNILTERNIFYPLIGDKKVDIMSGNTPEIFKGKNRIETFVISLTSIKSTCDSESKISDDILSYISNYGYGTRVNGFSPLFILILALSIAYGLKYSCNRRAWILSGILLLTCIVFEQNWWARYFPWIWAIPAILILGSTETTTKSKLLNLIIALEILVATASVVRMAGGCVSRKLFYDRLYEQMQKTPLKIANLTAVVTYKLNHNNALYIDVPISQIDSLKAVSYYDYYSRHLDIIELPDSFYTEITRPILLNKCMMLNKRLSSGSTNERDSN